ncbi:RNA 2'-phosphotransferase [Arthrobacter sp. 35W]|uniref:RNA 2'-phosphotransferase n=1 Tax=Arthrobacter sp. 35W TaxID=1132441 RepID=UPI0004197097|nr:RNA 2'-phosphotransferase [Arthrobacter sp. 35W]
MRERRYDLNRLSKVVSHALRHQPWLYGLEIDEHGWTKVDDLLTALRRESPDWADVELSDLDAMIAASAKPRHEIRGVRIRAMHGHSLPGHIRMDPAEPPPELFHGTSSQSLPSILAEGLRPQERQYVHLSADIAMARMVGSRKPGTTVVLRIDSRSAFLTGVAFHRTHGLVWLADKIPAQVIRVLDDPGRT